jgi:hypothetical protein
LVVNRPQGAQARCRANPRLPECRKPQRGAFTTCAATPMPGVPDCPKEMVEEMRRELCRAYPGRAECRKPDQQAARPQWQEQPQPQRPVIHQPRQQPRPEQPVVQPQKQPQPERSVVRQQPQDTQERAWARCRANPTVPECQNTAP